MEKQYKVGIVGATGMVGQRFVTLLENHPWFKLTVLAASGRSAGKTYEEAVGSRWAMTSPMPESVKKMVVLDASKVEEVASQVDFIFCAVNMPKDEIKALEEAYAKAECPVVSNNSANRFTPDVPMVVPDPLCCFGGAFCPHTSKSGFSCPDWFICSLIHPVQIKLCRYKPLVVILISGWRRAVFYLISKLIILSHKFSCRLPSRLISIKAEPDGSNLRMFPKKSLKWCICKHPKCQLI